MMRRRFLRRFSFGGLVNSFFACGGPTSEFSPLIDGAYPKELEGLRSDGRIRSALIKGSMEMSQN